MKNTFVVVVAKLYKDARACVCVYRQRDRDVQVKWMKRVKKEITCVRAIANTEDETPQNNN